VRPWFHSRRLVRSMAVDAAVAHPAGPCTTLLPSRRATERGGEAAAGWVPPSTGTTAPGRPARMGHPHRSVWPVASGPWGAKLDRITLQLGVAVAVVIAGVLVCGLGDQPVRPGPLGQGRPGDGHPPAAAAQPGDPRGRQRLGHEVEADEVGASLKWATAKVERAQQRGNGERTQGRERQAERGGDVNDPPPTIESAVGALGLQP
jgi:hypothetical protein